MIKVPHDCPQDQDKLIAVLVLGLVDMWAIIIITRMSQARHMFPRAERTNDIYDIYSDLFLSQTAAGADFFYGVA